MARLKKKKMLFTLRINLKKTKIQYFKKKNDEKIFCTP